MDELGQEYNKNRISTQNLSRYSAKLNNSRKIKIGRIFYSIGTLDNINEIFDGKIYQNHYHNLVWLGVFESKGKKNNRIRFVDNSFIAQYFPAYIRNKEKWDIYKGKWLTPKQLEGIIKGTFDYDWYKKLDNNKTTQENIDNKVNFDINENEKMDIQNTDIKYDNIVRTTQVDIIDIWK